MRVGSAGEPIEYASRSDAIGYFIALGGLVLVVAVAAICAVYWMPLRWFSIPYKDYWTSPERVAKARRMMVWDTGLSFSTLLMALSFVPVKISLTTNDPQGTSVFWRVAPSGLWLLSLACYVAWMFFHRYQPRSGA